MPRQKRNFLVTNFSNPSANEIDDVLSNFTLSCSQKEPLIADLMKKELEILDLKSFFLIYIHFLRQIFSKMANIPDAKQLDELSTNITKLSQKICNSIIEILSSTSNPEISDETRDTLVTLKFYMCNTTLHEATRLRTNITHLIASFQTIQWIKLFLTRFLKILTFF